MSGERDALLRFTLASASGPKSVELRIPAMAGVHPLVLEAGARDAPTLGETLPLLALQFVAQLDGAPLDLDRADAIARDAELMRGLLVRIRTLLETLRERGGVFVLCPRCGRWEAEVSMTALALTIATPLRSVFDGPFLALPALSLPPVTPARPNLERTARIRFELPSSRLGLGGPLSGGTLDEARFEPEEDVSSHDEAGWSRTGPGWRALARLSRAIQPSISAEQAEALPAIDFFFLDLLHDIAFRAPVRPDTAGRVRCESCASDFLPVR
jgi:hypothetical protein